MYRGFGEDAGSSGISFLSVQQWPFPPSLTSSGSFLLQPFFLSLLPDLLPTWATVRDFPNPSICLSPCSPFSLPVSVSLSSLSGFLSKSPLFLHDRGGGGSSASCSSSRGLSTGSPLSPTSSSHCGSLPRPLSLSLFFQFFSAFPFHSLTTAVSECPLSAGRQVTWRAHRTPCPQGAYLVAGDTQRSQKTR